MGRCHRQARGSVVWSASHLLSAIQPSGTLVSPRDAGQRSLELAVANHCSTISTYRLGWLTELVGMPRACCYHKVEAHQAPTHLRPARTQVSCLNTDECALLLRVHRRISFNSQMQMCAICQGLLCCELSSWISVFSHEDMSSHHACDR